MAWSTHSEKSADGRSRTPENIRKKTDGALCAICRKELHKKDKCREGQPVKRGPMRSLSDLPNDGG